MEFLSLNARRVLWQEYGVVVPGFDGEDAINAIILHGAEVKRREREQRRIAQHNKDFGANSQ